MQYILSECFKWIPKSFMPWITCVLPFFLCDTKRIVNNTDQTITRYGVEIPPGESRNIDVTGWEYGGVKRSQGPNDPLDHSNYSNTSYGTSQVMSNAQQFAQLLQAAQVDPMESVEAAKEMARWNVERYPHVADVSRSQAITSSRVLDQYMKDRFYGNIQDLLPTYKEDIIGTSRDSLMKTKDIADQLLTGEIPQDVRDQILRTRAEMNIGRGLYGEAASFATARDLGRTSYDLMMQGVDMTVNAVSPLTARLLSNTMSLQPPVTDVPGLTQQNQALLTGVGTVSPNATMQTMAQIGLGNADLAWSAKLSAFNAGMDMYQTSEYMDIMDTLSRRQMAASIFGSVLGAGGSIIGSKGSDRRLKNILATIGEYKGVKFYLFEYNEKAGELEGIRDIGVIAQEIEDEYPECLLEHDGYLAVNYDLLYKKLLEK